jgi:hypothetical protein
MSVDFDAGSLGELPEAGADLVLRPRFTVTVPKDVAGFLIRGFRQAADQSGCLDVEWHETQHTVSFVFVFSKNYPLIDQIAALWPEINRLANAAARQKQKSSQVVEPTSRD